MLRERIALIYDLLTLGDDYFDLKEIVGLGTATKRYDPDADNDALHKYLAEVIADLVAKGLLSTAVGGYALANGTLPIQGLSTRNQIVEYLNQAKHSPIDSFGIMVTQKGEEMLASLIELKQPA